MPLSTLNATGPPNVVDIWAGGTRVFGGAIAEEFEPAIVEPRDSGFFKLSSQVAVAKTDIIPRQAKTS